MKDSLPLEETWTIDRYQYLFTISRSYYLDIQLIGGIDEQGKSMVYDMWGDRINGTSINNKVRYPVFNVRSALNIVQSLVKRAEMPYFYVEALEENRRRLYLRLLQKIEGFSIGNDDHQETGVFFMLRA